ncbi:alpha/beta hydrolase [Aestuariivivens sediminis]|uniref:alpha/beta hydrolase n=1 Tax=Aestuariivivens sediminis TaxID=2913557 RepID=UPI001F5AAAA0|nr:alpha/beta hydrolase-fold protein [Aestuariivivens sediminis]
MKIRFIFIGLVICCYWSCKDHTNKTDDNPILGDEGVTFRIMSLPYNHDFSKDIYLSGNFEGWSGGREQFKLKKTQDQYLISIPKYRNQIQFKFTKGHWESVECGKDGNPIANRSYTFTIQNDTVDIAIAHWNDEMPKEGPSTAQVNVQVFDEAFPISQLHRKRKISVYLPPNYNTSGAHYPVLYMQDGQNLFDSKTSYAGEWEVDETLNALYNETQFGLIVVAIDHGGDQRSNEYAPVDHQKYGKGEGDAYVNFLVNTLKPAIDKTYRTKSDRSHTAIMGASMGGLIAHYALFKHSDVFGKAGVFSPAFWYAPECFQFTAERAHLRDSKLYYVVGGKEDGEVLDNVTKMTRLLIAHKFPEQQLYTRVVEQGNHNESLWKSEFRNAITWLFNIN